MTKIAQLIWKKATILFWYSKHPLFWANAVTLIGRKFQTNLDSKEIYTAATEWASGHAVPLREALFKVELLSGENEKIPIIAKERLEHAENLFEKVPVKMGGPGDIGLLFASVALSKARNVIETGVAYGWSTLAILTAQESMQSAKCASVDMPYPNMNNERWVGAVLPKDLKKSWTLVREPDRNGLIKALKTFNNQIDLCHYDSDKSYQGRMYAYPLLWDALGQGGVFISDDIQDNFAFRDFMASKNEEFSVTEYQGKFVGIARKRAKP